MGKSLPFDAQPILPLWSGSRSSHGEAHSRPPIPLPAATHEVWHWILQPLKASPFWEFEDPEQFLKIEHVAAGVLRWERHTEFWALTYAGARPIDAAIAQYLGSMDAQLMTGLRIRLGPDLQSLTDPLFFRSETLLGGRFKDGKVRVLTDFCQHDNGCVHFAVAGDFEDAEDRGRFVKRLIDLEIYRFNTLKGLSRVRPKFVELEQLERAFSALTARLSDDRELGLTLVTESFKRLSAQMTQLSDSTRYRVTATRAYHGIVQARLAELNEQIDGPLQSLTGFINQRLQPAFNTVEAYDRRLRDLERSVSTSLRLYHALIESEIQHQNQQVLKRMDQRTEQQVRLSKAVEGFSVIALTYYGVGLLAYVLKAAQVPLSEVVIAATIPFVAALVWWRTRRSKFFAAGKEPSVTDPEQE